MTWEQMLGFGIVMVIMLIGIVGSIIPAIPSTSLVLLAAVGHKLWFGSASVGAAPMVVLVLLAIITLALDYIASMIGAKKLGGSWWGIFGACVGALIGAFIPIFFIGIFIGTFVGAVGFEMIGGRELKHATRAGLGAVIGLLAGAVGKLAGCIAMIAIFSISSIANTVADNEANQTARLPEAPAVELIIPVETNALPRANSKD